MWVAVSLKYTLHQSPCFYVNVHANVFMICFTGGWVAGENDAYQYLQIDLEGLWEITSITTQDIDRWYWYATQAFRYDFFYSLSFLQSLEKRLDFFTNGKTQYS